MNFTPTRAAALSRLNDFLPMAGVNYARLRNTDYGSGNHDNVSTLSPYIRHRLITEYEVVSAVQNKHGASGSEKFVLEVFWRTYFKGWLEHRPYVWTNYQHGVQLALETMTSKTTEKDTYQKATSGQTSIGCFDHWVHELIQYGYLHNHARMWFASIWIFTLKLPWQLGADFFLRHLIDGDPASNTLSWRWVAGLHTKGKTYLATSENIARFTANRFNPQNKLSRTAEPILEPETIWSDHDLPKTDLIPDEDFLLLVHEDDCAPDSLIGNTHKPAEVLGALGASKRSPLGIDEKVSSFAEAAVYDTLKRLNSDAKVIKGNWSLPLISACKQHGLTNIVTAYPPVGPIAQSFSDAERDINKAGIAIHKIVRPWDDVTWAYANKGFFKVKKKIPKILENLHEKYYD